MGLLESLSEAFKSIFSRKRGEETAQAVDASLEELRKELLDREEKELDVSQNAKPLLDSIRIQVEELRQLVEKMEKTSISESVQHAEVGEGMRKQLVKRASLLFHTLEGIGKTDYRSLVQYHTSLYKFMVDLTKVVSDNRYIFYFMEEEMKVFSEKMRALGIESDELKNLLDSKKEKASGYESLLAEVNTALAGSSLEAEFEKQLMELEQEIRETTSIREAEPLGGLEEVRGEEKKMSQKQEELRAKTANALNPLQRLMRRYARLAPKQERRLAEKYAGDPVQAFFESNKPSELKKLLSLLRSFEEDEEGEDVRHLNNLAGFEEKAEETLEEYHKLESELREVKKKAMELEDRKIEARGKAERKKALETEAKRIKTKLEEEKTAERKLLNAIEEKAGIILGREVRIKS